MDTAQPLQKWPGLRPKANWGGGVSHFLCFGLFVKSSPFSQRGFPWR